MRDAEPSLRERGALLRAALENLVGETPLRFMEVCGTHTMALYRTGLRALLPWKLELVSGPGCPVCVTPQEDLDQAIALASRPEVTLATFGDLVRVPGSEGSLAQARAGGADVRVVTGASEALDLARHLPQRRVVFLAVGFETTAPGTAAVLEEARGEDVPNFLVLNLHKTVPPALEALAAAPDIALDGFLLPGHVCSVLGVEPFRFLPRTHGLACCVAGFEAEDLLLALVDLARQVRGGHREVTSAYPRGVRPGGNPRARALLERVFRPCDASWRGLGVLPRSGLALRDPFRRFDARESLELPLPAPAPPNGCRCGDVLAGRLAPRGCPLFGGTCTPRTPQGPCMVSSEGSCAAAYRYGGKEVTTWNV